MKRIWEYTTCTITELSMMGREGWEAYAISHNTAEVIVYLKRESVVMG